MATTDNKTKTDRQFDPTSTSIDTDRARVGGDFRLGEISIRSRSVPTGKLDLSDKSVFVSLNIFEDLFSNVLKGTFTFLDNQGWAERIPLIGDEDLTISYYTPGGAGTSTDIQSQTELSSSLEKSEEVVKQRFKIYDCEETTLTEGQPSKAYKISFVSYEYVINMKKKISKGYKGKFYHTIVKDVLDKINKDIDPSRQKSYFIEKTANPQNVIIPNWNPFKSINFCASRSVSSQEGESDQDNPEENQMPFAPGSLFVFYEKLGTGFFYESIESMIIKQKSRGNVPRYQHHVKSAGGASKSVALDYYGVDRYEIRSSFKTLENLGNGMYGSKLIAYDPIRMKYDEVKYDYYEKEKNPETETTDDDGITTVSTDPTQAKDDSQRIFADFIGTDIHPVDKIQNKLISEKSDYLGSNDSAVRLVTTTKEHDVMFNPGVSGITNIGVESTTFKDIEAKPNKVENWLLQRDAQVQEFDNISVAFTVKGNSSRHVGDLVRFEVPSLIQSSATDVNVPDVGHQLYSGYYLVSRIHHKITPDEYVTELELMKNSFAKRIPGQPDKRQEEADEILFSGETT